MNRSLLELVLHRVVPRAADARVADADLLRRFAADRDEAAFAALVRRHGPLVWAVCRQFLPHESDAEDAFQATFVALIRAAGTVRAPAALGAWLHAVACRVALNARRAAGRRRRREQAAATDEAVSPVSQTNWDQLQMAVHEEVRRLPEPLRTAFVLCELEGRGQTEVAASLGWKLGTLSGRLTKARQRLLERLTKRGLAAGAVVAGTVAVGTMTTAAPAALISKAAALGRCGFDLTGMVSETVLELARGATEVSMTRTKLMTASVAVVAALAIGTATTLIPTATSQVPPTPANDSPHYLGVPVDSSSTTAETASTTPAAVWEYKFVPRKGDSLEAFQQLLNEMAASRWEYCGTELLAVNDPAHKKEWGNSPTVVFKRPKAAVRSRAFGTTSSSSSTGTATSSSTTTSSGTEPETVLIHLEHVKASELGKLLMGFFEKRNCRIAIDERTNTLLVAGDPLQIISVRRIVKELDVAVGK